MAPLGLTQSLSAKKPHLNVVFFLIDDLGRNDLGCYGSKYFRTKAIDSLAKSGARFSDFYAACPVCSPTRASIMTGKYPARLNLTDWLPGRPDRPDQKFLRPPIVQQLPLEEITLAELFSQSGYVTGIIGKWHLGGEGFSPAKQGFQFNIAGDHTGTPLSYFSPFKNNQGRFMPGLEKAPENQYLPDRLALEAGQFLEQNRDKPFFLYLPHYSVHTPIRAPAERVAPYPADGRPGTQNNPVYAAMVESMDLAVGAVLKKLEDLKLAENTVVIFTSDNGGLSVLEGNNTPATINAPLREGKGYLYEGGIRVPLLVRWPGVVAPGTVTSTTCSSIDFFPTLAEICGLKFTHTVDGVSFAKSFQQKPGGEAADQRPLFWHYPHYSNQGGKPGSAIRLGNWKLIEFVENSRGELFDLGKDLGESRNVANEKPELVQQLRARLKEWRQSVGAREMQLNPNYHPNPQGKDGVVLLHSKYAEVFGSQLRYEPLPHKTTLGYWINENDWAKWEFEINRPGKFQVEVLQGCGTGQGGSEVIFKAGDKVLPFVVEDTGGFQQFKPRIVGELEIATPGRQVLEIRVKKKAKSAVMDVRQVRLVPVK
ncbi:MAG: DUF4976 domain-containing protein [Gemmataceae bacterium]|nr:DUF4976 domain-containing protein [Gemmataceae bacterium]